MFKTLNVSHTNLDMVISSAGLAPWLGQNDNRRIHVWFHVEQWPVPVFFLANSSPLAFVMGGVWLPPLGDFDYESTI